MNSWIIYRRNSRNWPNSASIFEDFLKKTLREPEREIPILKKSPVKSYRLIRSKFIRYKITCAQPNFMKIYSIFFILAQRNEQKNCLRKTKYFISITSSTTKRINTKESYCPFMQLQHNSRTNSLLVMRLSMDTHDVNMISILKMFQFTQILMALMCNHV